ncbi:hypothetical protein LEP1GSC060_2143 [Leptospira weilii serovar Ranarum str. ICFT]|uniref:Uncharacterized protein n=1 Tax=Leptospira weilii serovar Ranarum str. ICFT TaxID=1218598 RepID=N1WIM1_9LEPT|nr:hypothetical protein LEP1GSC060_2143 [Leptospira weilii serovar Ranarum str. ICFT]
MKTQQLTLASKDECSFSWIRNLCQEILEKPEHERVRQNFLDRKNFSKPISGSA